MENNQKNQEHEEKPNNLMKKKENKISEISENESPKTEEINLPENPQKTKIQKEKSPKKSNITLKTDPNPTTNSNLSTNFINISTEVPIIPLNEPPPLNESIFQPLNSNNNPNVFLPQIDSIFQTDYSKEFNFSPIKKNDNINKKNESIDEFKDNLFLHNFEESDLFSKQRTENNEINFSNYKNKRKKKKFSRHIRKNENVKEFEKPKINKNGEKKEKKLDEELVFESEESELLKRIDLPMPKIKKKKQNNGEIIKNGKLKSDSKEKKEDVESISLETGSNNKPKQGNNDGKSLETDLNEKPKLGNDDIPSLESDSEDEKPKQENIKLDEIPSLETESDSEDEKPKQENIRLDEIPSLETDSDSNKTSKPENLDIPVLETDSDSSADEENEVPGLVDDSSDSSDDNNPPPLLLEPEIPSLVTDSDDDVQPVQTSQNKVDNKETKQQDQHEDLPRLTDSDDDDDETEQQDQQEDLPPLLLESSDEEVGDLNNDIPELINSSSDEDDGGEEEDIPNLSDTSSDESDVPPIIEDSDDIPSMSDDSDSDEENVPENTIGGFRRGFLLSNEGDIQPLSNGNENETQNNIPFQQDGHEGVPPRLRRLLNYGTAEHEIVLKNSYGNVKFKHKDSLSSCEMLVLKKRKRLFYSNKLVENVDKACQTGGVNTIALLVVLNLIFFEIIYNS